MKQFTTILFLFLFSYSIFAQNTQTNDWIRVQSDNGEFSIEIPSKYHLIYSKTGYQESDGKSNSYTLKNIDLLNTFVDKTLLSFEVYEGKKEALAIFYESDKSSAIYNAKENKAEYSEKTINNNIKELIVKYDNFTVVRRYFNSKKFIYVVTAASREGETTTMKRFLESLVFNPASIQSSPNGGKLISSLQVSEIEVITKNVKPIKEDGGKNPNDPNVKPLKVAVKPRASYLDNARMNQVQGTINLRCTFTEFGYISRIEFINLLPEGMPRQVLFAVLRLKFLPEEKDGKTANSQKIVQYKFTLY